MKYALATLVSVPALVAATTMAAAQDGYPTQSIQLIVPYSAGGGGDTVSRLVAEPLSEALGVSVNVVNRDGAGGEIGISEMANADPDGYTIGVFGYPDNVVLAQTRDTDFDFDSLEYHAQFDSMPMGIFSSPTSAFQTPEDVQAHAEENPGEIVVGQSGALGLLHIMAFADELGVQLTPVAYDGGGELMNALLGNHIDLASTSSMSHDPIVDADGTPIGFSSTERMDMFPDVPTMQEQGLDLDIGVGRVLVTPAGLPDDVREVLAEALAEISTNEEMISQFENASLPYDYLDGDALHEKLSAQNDMISSLIEANIDQF